MIRSPRVIGMLLAALLAAAGAGAQELVTFGDWMTESRESDDKPECGMWSSPTLQTGNYTRRGDPFVFVTHRPHAGRTGEVFFEAGYDFKPDSRVEVSIGNSKFTLLTSGSTAWALSGEDEQRLVRTMRAGADMKVAGTSARGTDTLDTYSLRGFSAALDAISRACGINR